MKKYALVLSVFLVLLFINQQAFSFEPKTVVDGNDQKWASYFIFDRDSKSCGNSFSSPCYVNISEIETPYGKGVQVDSSGSLDYGYWFFGYSEKYLAPNDGLVTISGKFLKKDTIHDSLLEGRSRLTVFILSADVNEIIHQQDVLTAEDERNVWFEKETSFTLSPEEEFRVGIGRVDSWGGLMILYAAWADVKINAEKVSDTGVAETPRFEKQFYIVRENEAFSEEEWEILWIQGWKFPPFPNYLKEFQIYKIPYRITGGEVEKIEFAIGGFFVKIKPEEAGIFEIQIPRSLPVSVDPEGIQYVEGGGEFVKDFGEIETPCYRHFSIPFQSDFQHITLGSTVMPGIVRGEQVPDFCIIRPSPLSQVKNGANPQDIICKEGLELIFKSTDSSPACVKPSTSEKLIERGWGTTTFFTIKKTWIATVPTDSTNPWFVDQNKIKKYYEEHGISVYDVVLLGAVPHIHCEAVGCSSGSTLFLLISNSDVPKMTDAGFYVVPEPDKKYHDDTKHPIPL